LSVGVGEPDRGAASRLLTTLAIVRANADANQDYISNFEPFATDCLKSWGTARPVEPGALAAAICKVWGIPSLPTAVGKILLKRAQRRREVIKRGGLYPNVEKLVQIPSLAGEKEEMLAGMDALALAVVGYANDVHGLDWSTGDATDALERLADEFGAELAMAKQRGGLLQTDLGDDEALAVVHGFARRAIELDPANFKYLEDLVQGSMLVNAMYFPDVGHVSSKLKQLRVYLDTTPVLRALGLAAEPVAAATHEMLSLLRNECKVRMFVFPHTLTEVEGVLERLAGTLREGTASLAMQEASGRNREVLDLLVGRGTTPGEIEALNAELEARLRALGICPVDTPPHSEKGQVNEERLDTILDEVVGYRSDGAREKDMKSLTAVDRLRGNTRPRDLSQANAVFVTANTGLVQAGRKFFEEEGRNAPVPQAMHEIALTAQLWIRAPHPRPDLPGKLLIADCYAALNPTPELWARWCRHIGRLQESDEISPGQVQILIYHQLAKNILSEVTRGSPEDIGDDTVADVLSRFEADIRRPDAEAAKAELRRRKELEAERDALHHELEALRGLEAGTTRRGWHRAAERGRAAGGCALAVAVMLPFLVVGFGLGEILSTAAVARVWRSLKRGT
jgi:hypothetical protein